VTQGGASTDRLGAVLLSAYPDRLAQKRVGRGRYLLRSGRGAWVPDSDPLAGEGLLVVADLDGARGDARVRLAAGIDVDDARASIGDVAQRRAVVVWDETRGDVVARQEETLGALTLRSVGRAVEPSPLVTALLVDAVRAGGVRMLPWRDPDRRLQARIELARHHGRIAAPAVDDDTLLADIEDWLGPLLHAATGIGDVAGLDLSHALMSRIGWHHRSGLDRLVPEQFTLPSGRRVAIDYTRERPTITGRVQEFFGTTVVPAVLDGAVPLTVELLSPANRPVQVTADLAGFWAGSWHEVRKEMAGRYPKHRWPDDPTVAEPGRSTR
jgi:ATP-dependent helicase HrpB